MCWILVVLVELELDGMGVGEAGIAVENFARKIHGEHQCGTKRIFEFREITLTGKD
jgi:hypothetical protein